MQGDPGWLGIAIIGVAMMVASRLGERKGMLICRQCEFNLYGLPPEQTICPECGHTFHRWRQFNVQPEKKPWRPKLFWWGLGVTVVSLGMYLLS